MDITAIAWEIAQANLQSGASLSAGRDAAAPLPALPPDDRAAADFSRALEDGPAPVGPSDAARPPGFGHADGEIANPPAGVSLNLGDAILRGLTAIGKDITGGWNRLRLPMAVGEGGLPSAAEMFARQVDLTTTAFMLEVASKGAGKTVEHINQIVKQQ